MTFTFKAISVRLLKAILTPIMINVVLLLLFRQLNIIDTNLRVLPDGRSLSLVPVVIVSTVPVLVAGIIFWALKLLLSKRFIANIMTIALNLTHIVVGASTMYFFTRNIASDEK